MPKQPKPFKYRGRWAIRVTDEHGRRVRKSYNDFNDAQLGLRQHLAHVAEVQRGLRSPTPPDKTFGELADYWVKNRASQKRSGYHDESIIRCHLRPQFGAKLLKDISVADVDDFTCKRLHLEKKTLANHITLLISMLNAAVDLGWLLKAPKIRKPKVRFFNKDYRYLRTDEEVSRFLRAAEAEGRLAFALYCTAVFTGLRAGELAGLTWDDVDFTQRLITVQRSFDGPTKAGDVRYVPILDTLLPVLREWRLVCPGRVIFPNQNGGMQGESARIFQEIFHRVLVRGGFPRTEHAGRVRHYIRFHDLRHTFASMWMAKGGSLQRLSKILGHHSMQMTERYAHLAPALFTEDHGRFGSARPGGEARVIPFSETRSDSPSERADSLPR